MKTAPFRLVEHEDGYIIYQGDKIYETKLYTNIFVYDKGLGEVAVRRLNEDKPTLVNRYLCKFSREELLDMVRQLQKHDALERWGWDGTNDFLKCESLFSDRHIRQLIDGYTEIGSLNVIADLGMGDAYASFDPFCGIGPFEYFYNMAERIWDEEEREINFDQEFTEQIEYKYNACFLPPATGRPWEEGGEGKVRKRFYEKLTKLILGDNL